MQSDFKEPINIGSEEEIRMIDLWKMVIKVSGKKIKLASKEMPQNLLGVRHRNSNNDLIRKELGWGPSSTLDEGIKKTYYWILNQLQNG